MPKITVEHQEEFVTFPENTILHLKVDEVEVREVQGNRGTWEKLEIKFKVLGVQASGDGSPVESMESAIGSPIWGSVPFRASDSPENRLRQWAEAILGMELGVGFEFDTDVFEGRQVRGVTSQYTKRNGKQAHQIDSLLPLNGGGVQQAAAQSSQPSSPAPTRNQGFSFNTPPTPVAAAAGDWGSGDAPPF